MLHASKLDPSPCRPGSSEHALGQGHLQSSDTLTSERLQDATDGLRKRFPAFSAADGLWLRQKVVVSVLATTLVICVVAGADGWTIAAVMTTLPFACVLALRCLALWNLFWPAGPNVRSEARIPDRDLPDYTILVAMFREQGVARQLVQSLADLDYPADKLEVLFITEACDGGTRQALPAAGLRPNMRIISVPAGRPQTKPRALNYALAEARGDFVVVFDAEDEPEPDQLRKAVAAFAVGGADLACLQAQLKVHNAKAGWLTRQFAIEYAALFDLILPALARCGLPLTLGGTSNHFRRHVLEQAGGWDAYNVTEDADLGLRLARFGWRVDTLRSATWEEAPDTFRAWRRQRQRWLKGWLQTAIVLWRQPVRLWCELGARRCLALHALLASILLSAFVHPISLVVLAYAVATWSAGAAGDGLWWAGIVVFVLGYLFSIVLAVAAAWRSDHAGLARHGVFLPVYWLLISLAAFGAAIDLIRRPFHWHKTPHVGRTDACKADGNACGKAPLRFPG